MPKSSHSRVEAVSEIRTDIPPPAGHAEGRKSKYRFSEMKVGDSMVLPQEDAARIRPLITYHKNKMNKGKSPDDVLVDFLTRIRPEGLVVWRIS